VAGRASELGLQLDSDAARALVGHVGERQQRLLRELEKLALSAGAGSHIDVGRVEAESAASAERRAWSLADALVGGDVAAAVSIYLALRSQGERVSGLIYSMAQRVRTAIEVALALEGGESVSQVKRSLRMPSKAADRLIADARRTGSDRLREALQAIADLELESRGGGAGGVSEDTAAVITLAEIAG
jgi:DNA polymerase-3 subunit delta